MVFFYFQYAFRSSRSTADLPKVVSHRIASGFNMTRATGSVTLYIFKAFDRIWHADLLYKHMSCRIRGHIFGLISSFLSNRQL